MMIEIFRQLKKQAMSFALRGRSHDTGMTFIPERVHSIPIYFSVAVYAIPRRKLGPAQVIPE